MDFNDLNTKLGRLYAALGEQYDNDINSNIIDERKVINNGRFEHHTSFGSNDPAIKQNLVMNAIHLIGSLKDIIKQKLRDTGKDPALYETLIDNNEPLALITDIDNKDKHGDPLNRKPRSTKNPRIEKIQQALRGRGITNVAFTTNLITGVTKLDHVEGDVKVVVLADIVDGSGNIIMPLDKMMEESVRAIEDFVKVNNLI